MIKRENFRRVSTKRRPQPARCNSSALKPERRAGFQNYGRCAVAAGTNPAVWPGQNKVRGRHLQTTSLRSSAGLFGGFLVFFRVHIGPQHGILAICRSEEHTSEL